MKQNNIAYAPIDVQNSFKYVNFIIQEQATKNKWKIIDIKKYKNTIFSLLNLSLVIGKKFTSYKPKKIEKYLNNYSNNKFDILIDFVKNYYNNKISDNQAKLYAKKMLAVLSDYLRIITKVWNQGEGRMFAKFDEKYYKDVIKELNKF